jgi:DNA primase
LILDEYKMHCSDETFNPERFFLYHPNGKISQLTADLVTEKYTLSKVHSKIKKVETDIDRLIELVPRVIFELKNSLILDLVRQKLTQLKAASDARNNTRVDEIMREMAELEGVKKQLSKELGERIIIKI